MSKPRPEKMPTRALWLFVMMMALWLGSGCAPYRSKIVRTNAPSGSLQWQTHHGLNVHRDRRRVARESEGWSGLPDATRCVPQAHAYAAKARATAAPNKALLILGGVLHPTLIIAGIAIPAVYARVHQPTTPHVPTLVTGIGLVVSAFVISPVLLGVAMSRKAKARAHALDAVNSYNDMHQQSATCRRNTQPKRPTPRTQPQP